MKKNNINLQQNSKKQSKEWIIWLILGSILWPISVISIFIFAYGTLEIFVLIANAHPEWASTRYDFHHPALYHCQKDWFKFGNNIIRRDGYKLYVVKDGKDSNIEFEHDGYFYYLSNNILYVVDFDGVYAYNTEFEKTAEYDVKISTLYQGCFMVKEEYIYYENNWDIYKYSMISGQNNYLCHIDSNSVYLTYEKICYRLNHNDSKGFVDLEKDDYSYPGYSYTDYHYYYEIYNEKYGTTYVNDSDNQLIINEKAFDIDSEIRLGYMAYSNSDYLMLFTYNPCYDDCYVGQSCISQLKDVKLWKYDYQKETLSLVKAFNDYTVLIAFDENNYHYYYNGKLYSNDILIEELSFKLEVGNIFTYYAFNKPNFWNRGCAISKTYFSYIDGKFYYVHYDYPENNEVRMVEH